MDSGEPTTRSIFRNSLALFKWFLLCRKLLNITAWKPRIDIWMKDYETLKYFIHATFGSFHAIVGKIQTFGSRFEKMRSHYCGVFNFLHEDFILLGICVIFRFLYAPRVEKVRKTGTLSYKPFQYASLHFVWEEYVVFTTSKLSTNMRVIGWCKFYIQGWQRFFGGR